MTTDFIPDKAYLIKGKGIEQVKKEALESLEKLFCNITEYEDDSFTADGGIQIPQTRIEFKFYPHGKGTIIAFSRKSHFSDTVGKYFEDKFIVDVLKKDLVRHAQGREKLLWPTINKYNIFRVLFSFLVLALLFFLVIFGYIQDGQFIFLGVCTTSIVAFGIYLLLKLKIQKLSNLPEYKVEEYTGNRFRLIKRGNT